MNVDKLRYGVLAFAVASAAGCSVLRLSGNYVRRDRTPAESSPPAVLDPFVLPSPEEEEEAFRLRPSTGPARLETFTEEELKALYYYDLGPKEMDVSLYPKKHRENYEVFRQACSRCHTLARPINSPRSSRYAWEYYVFKMRLRGQFDPDTAFTQEQAERIVDFLSYDAKVRKGKYRTAFEVQNKRLQRRFDRKMEEKIRRMQQGRPLLTPP